MNLESQKAAEIGIKSLKIALKIVRCNEVGTSFALIVQKKKKIHCLSNFFNNVFYRHDLN